MTAKHDNQDDLFPWETEDGAAMEASAAAPAPPREERLRPRDERSADSRAQAPESGLETARDRPVVPREYYSISEVCELVDLKPHVLRYWETQFGPLSPSKNRSGNRVYQKKEIRLILLVKHLLYEEKYTVDGARAKLDQLRRAGRLPDMTSRAMTHDTATLVRNELEQVLEILSPARG
jgi:DNA-binding transcriptional MerR regulator